MKKIVVFLFTLVLVSSCQDKTNETADRSFLQASLGTINNLYVVTDTSLWQGEVGDTIRQYFAREAEGLPQIEPLFSINQMPLETFTGFAKKQRIVLHVSIGNKDTVVLKKNPYAKPQTIAFVTGKDQKAIENQIKENHERIIAAFKASELKENQRRINLSLLNTKDLEADFKVKFKAPSAYRFAYKTKDFYWIRKDLESGTTNILVYQVPLNAISNDSTALYDILKIRDSIGGQYLPVEDEGKFITDPGYLPYFYSTKIDNTFSFETKGVWEVKDEFMAGPFINYAIRDEKNNRYLILEGFTYAPSVAKRNLQFELESILKSASLVP